MYELTELLSSWWGAAVVLGLILLNAVALTGYWNRFQLDRRLSGTELQSGKEARGAKRQPGSGELFRQDLQFFSTWANRIYFVLTMGCALLLVSLPLFPVDNRTRFLLWLALTSSTLFGSYRLYLAWRGKDNRIRGVKGSLRSRKDFEESLDELSENALPLRIMERDEWLERVKSAYSLDKEKRGPISLIGFQVVGHEELAGKVDKLPADRVSVLVGDSLVRALRDEDLVCQAAKDIFFCMLKDCPQGYVSSIGDRITANVNDNLLKRASRIYEQNLTLVYVPLVFPEYVHLEDAAASASFCDQLWDALLKQSTREGSLV